MRIGRMLIRWVLRLISRPVKMFRIARGSKRTPWMVLFRQNSQQLGSLCYHGHAMGLPTSMLARMYLIGDRDLEAHINSYDESVSLFSRVNYL